MEIKSLRDENSGAHDSEMTYYYYGKNGVEGFTVNDEIYFYGKNLQGDITEIYDAEFGQRVGKYVYDAWGNCTIVTDVNSVASKNPFRYRGYYFDTETGLYYVKSRYYDPKTGRWISPEPNLLNGGFDTGAGIEAYNAYAYCANNPVINLDFTGKFVISTLIICVTVGVVVGGTIGGIAGNAYAEANGYAGWDKTKSILNGIGIGSIAGGVLGYFASPFMVSATGVAGISFSASGISTVVALGTSFGPLGILIQNNGDQIIDWSKTTLHAMQRMSERGVTQEMIELWVKSGKALQQSGEKILYVTKEGCAVLGEIGQLITTYTSNEYDEVMREVVKMLFGG